jgi:hypothetical protein
MKLAKFEIVFLIISLLAGIAAIISPTNPAGIAQAKTNNARPVLYPYPNPNPTVLAINRRTASSVTGASQVSFEVFFSKPVTGVDADGSDFALFTTGVSGAIITSVLPGNLYDNSFFVTVNTGSGNGTIRLDVPTTATIKDLSNNGLAGLPFTTGAVYTIKKTYPLPATATFGDAPMTHPYWADIEILYANGFTGGCNTSPLQFCPEVNMDRAQAAVFLLRGLRGTNYDPPTAPFATPFGDNWSPGTWAQRWAQGMLQENLTGGCSTLPFLYCPWEQMNRAQAAVFGMRLKRGSAYLPPAGIGTVLADINGTEWYAGWVEEAYTNGLLPACGSSGGLPLFCPNSLVSRGLGAYMLLNKKTRPSNKFGASFFVITRIS